MVPYNQSIVRTLCGPGHSHSTGEMACVAILHSVACVSDYWEILTVIWYACMALHAQLWVQHWIDWFPFEMITIIVSGDHTWLWCLLGDLIAINDWLRQALGISFCHWDGVTSLQLLHSHLHFTLNSAEYDSVNSGYWTRTPQMTISLFHNYMHILKNI